MSWKANVKDQGKSTNIQDLSRRGLTTRRLARGGLAGFDKGGGEGQKKISQKFWIFRAPFCCNCRLYLLGVGLSGAKPFQALMRPRR